VHRPLAFFAFTMRSSSAGRLARLWSAIASSMRGRSCTTMRPAADVHVANFRIPHLRRGQAYGTARRGEKRMRAVGEHALIVLGFGARDRIVFCVGPRAPAVEDAKHGRAGTPGVAGFAHAGIRRARMAPR